MQTKNKKTLILREKIGELITRLRNENGYSCRKFAYEYDISRSNLNKIENSEIDCKVITLWKISEALGIKMSELMKILEEELGEKFTLIDK